MLLNGLILVNELERNASVSENLVSEKSLGFVFGKFGIGKKSWYQFWSKFWYRQSVIRTDVFEVY